MASLGELGRQRQHGSGENGFDFHFELFPSSSLVIPIQLLAILCFVLKGQLSLLPPRIQDSHCEMAGVPSPSIQGGRCLQEWTISLEAPQRGVCTCTAGEVVKFTDPCPSDPILIFLFYQLSSPCRVYYHKSSSWHLLSSLLCARYCSPAILITEVRQHIDSFLISKP